jgi:hypothetical protein
VALTASVGVAFNADGDVGSGSWWISSTAPSSTCPPCTLWNEPGGPYEPTAAVSW